MTNCTENRNRRKDRFTERPDDLAEYSKEACSVDLSTLFEFRWNLIYLCFYQNDVIRSHNTRDDVCPECIGQT